MKKKINKKIPKYKFGAAEVSGAVSTAASGIAGAAGISQDSAVGGALKGLGAGLSSIPTPYTQIAGAALSTVGSFWGEAGSVNQQTGEINKGSGLSRLFGRSQASLRRESNRIKNSIVDRELTAALNHQYYNDPNNSANMNVFAAAEGAVVRKPVLAKVSPGELRIDPNTLKYEEIPGDGGKPNDDDNVTKILGEGEIIASNAEHMKMPNGKTPADNAKAILDSNMSEQQKKKMIKKLTNWQEANKTEPQEYAKYAEGESFVEKAKRRGKIIAQTEVDGKTYVKLGDGNWYDTVNGEVGKRTIKTSKLRKAFATADAEFQQKAAESVAKANDVTIPNGGYDQNWESDVMKNPIAQELFGQNKKYRLFTPQEIVERSGYNYGPTYANYNPYLGNYDFSRMLTIPENYGVSKSSNNGGVPYSYAATTKSPVTPTPKTDTPKSLTAPTYTPSKPDITLGRNKLPELPKKLPNVETKDSSEKTKDKSNINWLDYLNLMGPLANIFSSKPEKVDVYAPRAEFGPTYYNERPAVEQANLNRAITNYNASKVNPNTGANMAFTLQSQMNTDTAIGNILAQKENIQNQRAFSNTGIYNDWSNRYANARHVAAVEQAQNDAASRNIKRKGVGDLFTNVGKIVRDRRLSKRDAGLYEAMLPYLEYGMTSDQLKKLTELYD